MSNYHFSIKKCHDYPMHFSILSASKTKASYLLEGEAEFIKRLKPKARVTIDELSLKHSAALAASEVLKLEAQALTKKLTGENYIIALAIDGLKFSSENFAKHLETQFAQGCSKLHFVIGGAYGLDSSVTKLAQLKMSFSSLTFNHQLCRLLLLEQLYRAVSILNGDPYHK